MRLASTLIFLAFPFLEIALLIKVGQILGFWPTLGLLIAGAVLGLLVIRHEGMAMVGRMLDAASAGRWPVAGMLDTYAALVAGFLLIIPGFISDIVGLLLLIPPIRHILLAPLVPSFAGTEPPTAHREHEPSTPRGKPHARPIIIEGTYERIDDDPERRR